MGNLWCLNSPQKFWLCQPNPSEKNWEVAIVKAQPVLGTQITQTDCDSILAMILGEERYGSNHWELGGMKRIYYQVKHIIPRPITRRLRRFYNCGIKTQGIWPIEQRYARFLWEVLQQVLVQQGSKETLIKQLWPENYRFSFVLTHDIETAAGQEFVDEVAGLEENLGYRSLFNFVPERYRVDYRLMDKLRWRGFEIGVHGLKHNGRLFASKSLFLQNANRINKYVKNWKASGFRAELTHRQPEWMQALEIEYDLSFFDTDPYEPIPGGTMSIWPFFIGHFVELPYTLVQDYTLTSILGETSPRLWLQKVDFIERYHGMALINTHPDYLKSKSSWDVYRDFLLEMKKRDHYWHALPKEVACWWRIRSESCDNVFPEKAAFRMAKLMPDGITII
jgi:hypothetical protein